MDDIQIDANIQKLKEEVSNLNEENSDLMG